MSDTPFCYLVAGADSMVGSALITRLQQTGARVLGTTRRQEKVGPGCIYLHLVDDLRQWRPPAPVSVAILCAGETRIQECKNNPATSAQVNVAGISQIARNLRSEGTFVIYLSTNQLSGSIPSQLGLLGSLGDLRLSGNQLSGPIPTELGNLHSLTLLYLGVRNIRLGPSLPAFITPNVLDVLVKNFNIMPISTPEEDLKAILG